MEIQVKLVTSPEGIPGLTEGMNGEKVSIHSSQNPGKVIIETPKGEILTFVTSDLIEAIQVAGRRTHTTVDWGTLGLGLKTNNGSSETIIIDNKPSWTQPWLTPPEIYCNGSKVE